MKSESPAGPPLRMARIDDAPAIARVTNAAYVVEDFFKIGERTDEDEVAGFLQRDPYIVADDPGRGVVGGVHLEIRGALGYFGMLAVAPAAQHHGLGKQLIAGAERYCAQRGCTTMQLDVVNLRTTLVAWYETLGYTPTGRAPFPEGKSRLPCEFVVMQKPLTLPAVEVQEVTP